LATMILMCGLSGVGKSTWAGRYKAQHPEFRYLGIDVFYNVMNGDNDHQRRQENEFDVWMMFYRAIHNAEMQGVDCLIDTNAPTIHNRSEILNWFHTFDKFILVYVKGDEATCRANNNARHRTIPEDEMDRMVARFQVPTAEEDPRWDEIWQVTNSNNTFSDPVRIK